MRKESYLQSVSKVITYIETHTDKTLTLEELAAVAGFSKYHFHRIFKSVTGENLADYITKVRLQNSILKFKTSAKVTQIALESGYETNASFSKAFKKRFALTPREFAKQTKQRKGDKMIEPQIIEIEPIEVFFVRATGDYKSSASKAWEAIVNFAYANDLSTKVKTRYGIAHDNPSVVEADDLRYDACLELLDTSIQAQADVGKKYISGGKYAIFLHCGSYELLGETYKNIGDWIVQNNVELRDEPQFQKYLDLDPREVQTQDLRTEIYVPLQ